jgi:hypothetical protein
MGKQIVLVLTLCAASWLVPPSAAADKVIQFGSEDPEVIIFRAGIDHGGTGDIASAARVAIQLNLSVRTVDYRFINKRESFFDSSGRRKFSVLIMGGGEPAYWFKQYTGMADPGITCQGVKNVMDFLQAGGSVIAICWAGSSLFAAEAEWLSPGETEAQKGLWDRTHHFQGWFRRHCGVYAFKGKVSGPQETNRPYPRTLFLPIRMNAENEILRGANLPAIIPLLTIGGGSLFPDKDQPIDVIGWYLNGTIAIGIIPYGSGRIVLSNPLPNRSGPGSELDRERVMSGPTARRWGWTDAMMREIPKILQDNPVPDRQQQIAADELAKAMLLYAYKKASK